MFLAIAIFPTIKLNTTTLKSGEPLQISCLYGSQSNQASSYIYEILLNDTTVASSKKSFVHTIQSVRSSDAGTYFCRVVTVAIGNFRLITLESSKVILSGKSTF